MNLVRLGCAVVLFFALAGASVGNVRLVDPTPGRTLDGSSVRLVWTVDGWVTESWIYVGSTQGGRDLLNSENLGRATSVTAASLPLDGRTLFVRIWYRATGLAWFYTDYTLTAARNAAVDVRLVSPASGSTLRGSADASWMGVGVVEWWLYGGTAAGGSDLYNSGSLGTAQSVHVPRLPQNGATVWLRLWWRESGSSTWRFADYSFITASLPSDSGDAQLLQPVPGTTLGRMADLMWNGSSVAESWVYGGSAPGGSDLHNSGNLYGARRTTLTNLPQDGRTVYVRLYTRPGSWSLWNYKDYQFQATSMSSAGEVLHLLQPVPGSSLSASSLPFSWTLGQLVTDVWVYLGTSQGAYNLHNSNASLGRATGFTANNLPLNGQPIWLRIWVRTQGSTAWSYLDFTFGTTSGAGSSNRTRFAFPVGDEDGRGWLNNRNGYWYLEDGAYRCGTVPHPGLDMNMDGTSGDQDRGQPVYAVADGVVLAAGHYGSVWLNIVLIEHTLEDGTRVWSQYGHLDAALVQPGTRVSRRQQIGKVGKPEGLFSHLHFELRSALLAADAFPCGQSRDAVRAQYLDPVPFIQSRR